jgi:hypothetical protein
MYIPVGLSARWYINFSLKININLLYSIFNITDQKEFLKTALEVFEYQYNNNPVYQSFVKSLKTDPYSVRTLEDIPFLPVEFFRNQKILTCGLPVEKIFESSGTTAGNRGKHFVSDLALYENSFLTAFRFFYGDPAGFLIVALLPSYTERENSSLVYMVDKLIKESKHPQSGFYTLNNNKLITTILKAREGEHRILLLGVSFALLDLAEKQSHDLSGIIVMETGGMKGRRKELTRMELHAILKERFNVTSIHSEYGMTELLSQAYSKSDGIFFCPPWMKILIRDPQDPLSIFSETGRTGGINIIDLANVNSCSFISTGDLGRLNKDGGFEVLGRFDNSEIRGCNLLVE